MRIFRLLPALLLVCAPAALAQWIGRPEPAWEKAFQAWVADPHKRVYPSSFGRDLAARKIELEACRNEHVVFQLGVRSPLPVDRLTAKVSEMQSSSGDWLPSKLVRVRYPGLIPVDENAQYTPDPLWEVDFVPLRPYQSQGIWLDLKVPKDAKAGMYRGTVEIRRNGVTSATFNIQLRVLPVTLPEPFGFHCYLNILVDPASVARMNKLPLWGEEHWKQLDRYVRNLAEHGQKTITAFIVDDPWAGITGFAVRSLVEWKYPGEWKPGSPGKMSWDFTSFDRFVAMCLEAGIRDHIESWSPLVQPGTDHSVVIYTDTATGQPRKLRLPAGSPEYKAVWGGFAGAFQEHLRAKGWLDKTYLAFDEIKSEVLDRVVPFFHEVAPDLKLMISGGDEKGRHMAESGEMAFYYGHYSPGSPAALPDIPARRAAGKRTLLYTAVYPYYPNTFLFSEPHESRYMGWIIYKWGFDGYIRWAWNFWPETLWDQPFFTWWSGDMFFVYPGKDGPVDSIRWEMLREGLEDYECLYLARQRLKQLRDSGKHLDLVERGDKDLRRAVDLATQQFDRTGTPRDTAPAKMDEARHIVNALLVELSGTNAGP